MWRVPDLLQLRQYFMGMRIAIVICGLLAFSELSGEVLPAACRFQQNGSFSCGDARFSVVVADGAWKTVSQDAWQNPSRRNEPDRIVLDAVVPVGRESGRVREIFSGNRADSFSIDCSLQFDRPVQLNAIYGELRLPAEGSRKLRLDGKEFFLPAQYEKRLVAHRLVKKLELPLAGGLLLAVKTPGCLLTLQDNRHYGMTDFSLRLSFAPTSGRIQKSQGRFDFHVSGIPHRPVDISAAANRGFRDEIANDGRGGWTDQGANNDMRTFQIPELSCGALTFRCLVNRQPSVVVIGGEKRNAASVSVPVRISEQDSNMRAVNLLHAIAWPPASGKKAGEILVRYRDGSQETIPVISGRDVGNWWLPRPLPNGTVAWRGHNAENEIGLYVSSFPLKRNDPRELSFRAVDPEVLWLIPAVTLSQQTILPMPSEERPWTPVAGADWIPIRFSPGTAAGSPLDFSALTPKPAGQYGFVTPTAHGALTFSNSPERRARFFGVNLCMSALFPERKDADRLAVELARNGYNLVRLHHIRGILKQNAADTLTFDPAALDRLDYLVAALKRNGIYIAFDLYDSRLPKPGDAIPECHTFGHREYKALLPVSRSAMRHWKEFARRWVGHRNPYTGLTWREEPALAMVNLVNEDVLHTNWAMSQTTTELYLKRFEIWKQKSGCPDARAGNDSREFLYFLQTQQDACLEELLRFAKQELKLRCPVTSLNYLNDVTLALSRKKFDLVDNHGYFDHPVSLGSRSGGWKFGQGNPIERRAQLPRAMMPTRIFGKPFFVSEFSYCSPNRFRLTGGLLLGAYASLQDWDGLCRFAWTHNIQAIKGPAANHIFDAAHDPLLRFSDLLSIALFRRGDLQPGSGRYGWLVRDNSARDNGINSYPLDFQLLGLITQIGSVTEGAIPSDVQVLNPDNSISMKEPEPADIARLWRQARENNPAVSSTGEIRLVPQAGTCIISTPKTQAIVLPEGSGETDFLRVDNADGYQAVAVISLDGAPLSSSGSILLLHLADVLNSGMVFGSMDRTVVTKMGAAPQLLRRRTAKVALKTDAAWQIRMLDFDGTVRRKIPGSARGRELRLVVDTGALPGGVMAYHFVRTTGSDMAE